MQPVFALLINTVIFTFTLWITIRHIDLGKSGFIHIFVPASIISMLMFIFGIFFKGAPLALYLLVIFSIATLVIHLYYRPEKILVSLVIAMIFTAMWFAIQIIIFLMLILIILLAFYIKSVISGGGS